VEGDVTRFTPIFLCQPTIGLTGPVRSARYYTLDLNQSLHVLPYFFGAEHEAIRRFSAANMPYVNGIFGTWPGSWFLRSGTNPAPHNLYTNLEAARSAIGNYAPLDALVDSVGPPRPPFNFDPAAVLPADGRAVAGLEVRTNAYWRIGWTWDASSSSWLRSDAGVANVDEATGTQLRASTVVVQKVVETVDNTHHDPAGNPRRVHQLVGSGTGIVYSGGRAFDVRWSRADAQAGTTWTYASTGQPVILPPGVVWWEIVPTYSTFTED